LRSPLSVRNRIVRIALLLFGSGFTALVYQVVWFRELRTVFGFSTAATSAVVAIFMGGLGVGSWILGRRADRAANPLSFYGQLELAIAASAAVTPALLWAVRSAYIASGGSARLGLLLATAVRLLGSGLVLAVPTILMGGTLPAATRAAETDEDRARRYLALLYGANTVGAVTGTVLATFYLLEAFGTRGTLWASCVVNGGVGLLAVAWGGPAPQAAEVPQPEEAGSVSSAANAPASDTASKRRRQKKGRRGRADEGTRVEPRQAASRPRRFIF